MDIGATTALLPVERAAALTLKKGGHQRAGNPANPSGSPGNFVFLGYGPRSATGLYDEAGKHVPIGRSSGSVVDLYI